MSAIPGGPAGVAPGLSQPGQGGQVARQAAALKQTLWPELEGLGEAKVREQLDMGIYRGGTRFYAEEWLRSKEFPRAAAAIRGRRKTPGNAANRAAMAGAAAVAVAALFAHWTLIG